MPHNLSDFYRKLVVNFIRKSGKPISTKTLYDVVSRKVKNFNPNVLDKTLEELLNEHTLRQLNSGSFVLSYDDFEKETDIRTGTVSINSKGDGFIKEDETEVEYYVNKKYLNGALKFDKVKFVKLKKEPKNELYDAAIIEVVEHSKDYFVGVFKKKSNQKGYEVQIDDPLFYLEVELDDIKGLVNNHKILLHIIKSDNKKALCEVVYIIGHMNDVGNDILSIVYDNGINPIISEEVNEAAAKCVFNVDEHQKKIRRFLFDRMIVSIDPEGSKDIDDAVFVKKLNVDKYFLSVNIADVSFYVQPGTVLDQQARKQGTSVYLADRVIPMLPHNISNNICSLNQHEERMAITVDMIIHRKGHIVWKDIYPSVIKSQKQLSYDEVNYYFKNNLRSPLSISIKEMLDEARELSANIRQKRKNDGYVSFDIKEPKIILNDKGIPIRIEVKDSGIAEEMIEDFMITANEAVTTFVNEFAEQQIKNGDKDIMPFIYRVHDKPSIESLKRFEIESKKLAFHIDSDHENIKPNSISNWLEGNKDNENLSLISKILLRAMAKASYEIKNTGHFGLALEDYTHFTSPIRRYPDLLVHRLLWMYVFDREAYSDKERQELKTNLKVLCDEANKNEIIALKTERDVNACKFAEYMNFHLNEEFDGVVVAVNSFGVFIELVNTIEGLLRISNLDNDYYTYIQENNTLVGQNSNNVISIGKKVRVKVIDANKLTRKIEFSLVKFYR